jgi:hypothetical protein
MYILNGTVFLVSDQPSTLPDKHQMTSTSAFIENGREAELSRLPTDKEMRFVSTAEAKLLFSDGADIIPGVTVILHPSCFSSKFTCCQVPSK